MNRRTALVTAAAMLVALFSATHAGVNSRISVDDGEVVDRNLSTVNGSIRVGDGAAVSGKVSSVNGSVRIGRDAEVERVSSVNGGVTIGDGSVVHGKVSSVNGSVELDGARAGSVSSVNGRIDMTGATVEDGLRTYLGDITLRRGSIVGGDIIVEKSDSRSSGRRSTLTISIEDGSVVRGGIIVEDPDIDVEVILRGGSVEGRVEGATVVER